MSSSIGNRVGWIFRIGLGLSVAGLVAWSFYWVMSRPWRTQGLRKDQTELRVLHWGDKNEDSIIADLVADFEGLPENRDIKIVRINLGQAAAVNTKLQTMLAAGDPPDVFYLGFEKVADLAAKGLLADIESFIREDQARNVPTLDLADFFPAVLRCFRWDDAQQRIGQGTLIGLPKDFTTVGFYYNRDLFRKAGVPEPSSEGWTWDEFIAAARAIGKLPGCYGADFVTWEAMVRLYLWNHGLDFTNPTFTEDYFDKPEVHACLEKLQNWFLKEDRTLVSAKTQLETGQEPFLAGNVGMAGPYGRWKVPTYRLISGFDWDFAPLPHMAGSPPRNGVFTVAWAIAERCRHRPEAWRFVKYLAGPRAQERMCRSGLAIPVLRSVAESPVFCDPDLGPVNDRVYLDAAEVADPIGWPADPKYLHQLRVQLEEIFKLGHPVAEHMRRVAREWEENRRSSLQDTHYAPMPWRGIFAVFGVAFAITIMLAGIVWWRRRPPPMGALEERWGMMLVSPWVIGFILFTAFPIVLSLLLTFTQWSGMSTLDRAKWAGLANLRQLWFYDKTFHHALAVTAWYVVLAVPSSQIVALAAAMMMNRSIRGIGFFRAVWYLPSVLTGVGMAVMWKWVFHHEHGLAKALLDPLLSPWGWSTPAWLERDAGTWGIPAFAFINLWTLGGTMMVYLAGLQGIPKELAEASEMDGAASWRRFINVTLPMLSPVILFNVIMAIIGSFQIFTQAYVMTAGGPGDATRFYVVYLYNQAFDFHEMGYASGMAWILLIIILILTLAMMKGSRRFVYYEALK